MKNRKLVLLFMFILCLGCRPDETTSKVDEFLKSHNLNIQDYKVICQIPVDGCESCIDPSLDYATKEHEKFLLVLSSDYEKSIDYTLERFKIKTDFIIDSDNLAPRGDAPSQQAPYFYFIKNGAVINTVDLFPIFDKTSILKDVEKFLLE